jgi:GNAT superfamily N-acetyltransferase
VEKLEIRAAVPEDLKSIKAVFKSHEPDYDWKFAKRYYRSHFESPDAPDKDAVLVGVVDGRVAGVIGYLRDRRGAPGVYWIGWFYVHRDSRGHNVGRRLLEHAIAAVKARGGRKLYTDTSSFRFYDRAHHLYREVGFQQEGTLRDYY